MKTERKINYVIYPNQLKISKKTGNIPLYVRIVVGNKAEWNSGIEITPANLSKWNKATYSISEKYCETNTYLNSYQSELSASLKIFEESENLFSASEIKKILLAKNETKRLTIINYLQEYYFDYIENNVNFATGTKKNYKKAINHLKKFISLEGMNDAPLSTVTYDFASRFKNYLTNSDLDTAKKGMCENSAKSIIKKFRTIFTEAVSRNLLSSNPFKMIKLVGKPKEKTKLNIHQINALHNSKNLSYSQQVYTDIFLFSVYTGLAYADAQALNTNYLTEYGIDLYKVDSSRMKTTKTFSFFLPDLALEIIDKYKNTIETLNGNLIPQRSIKEINLQLKILADKAEIPVRLTTHYGRHAFRAMCGEAGCHDETIINKMMGLSLGNSMHRIYDQATDSRLKMAKEKLDLYLKFITKQHIDGRYPLT